jgi:FMN phosphatase YigB (HAD superfamily)
LKKHDCVFLFDVDNTLLDNDKIQKDLRDYLIRTVGPECEESYWQTLEQLRSELGYVDYLGSLQRYRIAHPRDLQILSVSKYLIEYPFANRLYPGSLDAVAHVSNWGPAAILSDGDAVFQPWKVERSGLAEAFHRHVLIYIHKEDMLDDVEQRFPADHYVMVDDKLRILDAIKKIWKDRVTTVFVDQGHYAKDPANTSRYSPADIKIERIGDLAELPRARFLADDHSISKGK